MSTNLDVRVQGRTLVLNTIYAMNPASLVLVMISALLLWNLMDSAFRVKYWRAVNILFAFLSVFAILYATLLNRTVGEHEISLRPFRLLYDSEPELTRAMFMNILLFFPLGLSMSTALPGKRWFRIALTVATGFFLSLSVEYTQFRYGLGVAELDDVICNTLGCVVGSLNLVNMTGHMNKIEVL